MATIWERVSLSPQADTANTQKDINVEFKADSITDKNNIGETEAIINEGV